MVFLLFIVNFKDKIQLVPKIIDFGISSIKNYNKIIGYTPEYCIFTDEQDFVQRPISSPEKR